MKILQLIILAICLIICIGYLPYCIVKRNYSSLKFLTLAIIMQNMMSLFASNVLPGILSQIIILYKEIILWGAVLYSFICSCKIKKYIMPIFMFMLIIMAYFFVGEATVYGRLISFRQLMTPIILILYGRTLKLKQEEIKSYFSFIINLGIVQAFFGILERFVLGDAFWKAINIQKLFETKGFSRWVLSELPGNYYSYDLYNIMGVRIRRLVGFSTDPLLTAHYLAFCIVILLFAGRNFKKMSRIICLGICTVACVLTLSKGAILIVGIAYLYKIWLTNKKIAIGLIGIFIIFAVTLIRTNLFMTVAIHAEGLWSSVSIKSFIGNGIGTAGNLASLNGESSTAGESYFGMVIGQIGYIGLFVFLYVIYRMIKISLRKYSDTYVYSMVAYIIAVILEATMSESAINFVGSGCAFIILGIYSNQKKNKRTKTADCNGIVTA